MKNLVCFLLASSLLSCSTDSPRAEVKLESKEINKESPEMIGGVFLIVLGNVQDAGSPQISCRKKCCADLFENPKPDRMVVSLGLVDNENHQTFLFEATPNIANQIEVLSDYGSGIGVPNGTFLTHAHIGHYTGLMYLGKEALNTNSHPVYAMPKMKLFLENNGPWDQLVSNKNISIKELSAEQAVQVNSSIQVIPFTVPHRDEYSETVGYKITGPNKSALFIPDIDKWSKWERSIVKELATVDYAFLDATFYDAEEINNRDISEIPHPFVVESMSIFESLSPSEKNKVIFIHFNHTNPLLNNKSDATKAVENNGFNIAKYKDIFRL